MASREVRRISRLAYDLRSYTGHQGSLFGSEQTSDYSPHPYMFNVVGDAAFDYVILGELRSFQPEVAGQGPGMNRIEGARADGSG
ncbi:MAG: hypothetical protein ABSA53_32250 [Streptosporangiaceae bacterium]|jgi:hypothetical protein